MTTEYAGDYGGGYTLTCVLYEGTYTVTTTGVSLAGGKLMQPSVAFSAEVSVGDYVGLHVDTANTFAAAKGLPVVTTLAATNGVLGRVITEPRWARFPSSTTASWAADLARQCYRTAVVEMFNVTSAHKASIEGTTDVEVGAPLQWDLSLNAYKDAGTTATGAFSFHYQPNATPENALVGFGVVTFTTGNDDCMGIETVA